MPTIRFCGGPWHNKLLTVSELEPKVVIRHHKAVPCGITQLYKYDLYFLSENHTEYGTTYWQYVHRDWCHEGYASPASYREMLPRWKISRRQLDNRIRRALDATVGLAGSAGDAV